MLLLAWRMLIAFGRTLSERHFMQRQTKQRISMLLAGVSLFMSSGASAQTGTTVAPPPKWVVAIGTRTIQQEGRDIQPAATLSIVRNFGESNIAVNAATIVTSSKATPRDLAPDRIDVASLVASREFGDWAVEAHLGFSRSAFTPTVIRLGAETPTVVTSSAGGMGVGISVTRAVALTSDIIAAPYLEADYAASHLNRAPLEPTSSFTPVEARSSGWTYAAGSTLQWRLGKSRRHRLTARATLVRMDDVTDLVRRTGQFDPIDFEISDVDLFAEFGAMLDISLSLKRALRLSITKSAWVNGPQSVVASSELRLMF